MKAAIGTAVSSLLTSPGLRVVRRLLASSRRRLSGAAAQVHYFHQADDPYSHLLVQVLPDLLARYKVELCVHLVAAPSNAAAPDRERLQQWSRRDAAQLAAQSGLSFKDMGQQPAAARLALAESALLDAIDAGEFLQRALNIGAWLWQLTDKLPEPVSSASAEQVALAQEESAALRRRLGHYLGGMLYFESDWFWGLDRLGFLQQRLQQADLNAGSDQSPLVALPTTFCRLRPQNGQHPKLYFYCSLRSPYTYLAAARVRQLAEHYGAELQLRPILPMVMRGLPVPLEKRLYIVRDCKRLAEQLGLRFGRIADPVGVPTERGLAVLFRAMQAGKGSAFIESFLQGVWSEGIDAGSEAGLLKIATRAGLDEAFVQSALADQSWRKEQTVVRARL